MILNKEMAAEKQSKDAATSHLRNQAFQRALIRNGANFDILYEREDKRNNKYKIQQKSLEVTKTNVNGNGRGLGPPAQ